MSKSNYIYEVGDILVKITDLDSGGMSVTNNAENVLSPVEVWASLQILGKSRKCDAHPIQYAQRHALLCRGCGVGPVQSVHLVSGLSRC